jgi:uncharacterized membrane protein
MREKMPAKLYYRASGKVGSGGWWGLPPFRRINPGWEEHGVKGVRTEVAYESRARLLSQTALIAAVYGVGTYAIAPIAFGPFQARITDALLPVSWNKKVGLSGVLGVTLGVVISNLISPYGLPDIVLGTAANLVVASIAYWLRRYQSPKALAVAALQASVVVAFLIGVVLQGWIYSLNPAASFVSVLAGELVSCVGLGVPLNLALTARYR